MAGSDKTPEELLNELTQPYRDLQDAWAELKRNAEARAAAATKGITGGVSEKAFSDLKRNAMGDPEAALAALGRAGLGVDNARAQDAIRRWQEDSTATARAYGLLPDKEKQQQLLAELDTQVKAREAWIADLAGADEQRLAWSSRSGSDLLAGHLQEQTNLLTGLRTTISVAVQLADDNAEASARREIQQLGKLNDLIAGIGKLDNSTKRVENLTRWLVGCTIALLILTAVLIVVTVT